MNRQSWNFGNHWDSSFPGPAAPPGCKSQIKSPQFSCLNTRRSLREHLIDTIYTQMVNKSMLTSDSQAPDIEQTFCCGFHEKLRHNQVLLLTNYQFVLPQCFFPPRREAFVLYIYMICLEANYHSSSHLFDSSLLVHVLHCTMYTIGNT